ncbi:NERD domain-containing protein [Acinetobacter gandensis]|uniref:NERD nuclease n=1 Tax=Acinetobacter gandensis TaxID=1443941 RepID=A0A1A7RC93_9GAMM|nr:nuclease-related domain-containing protein [Acinetobacter gandensis]KAB0624365.1 NERD domain-containing protein [Acinetobacter gandensis]OBX29875.1 NERD nuclease [Acinetobacter gandensis]
MNISQIFAPLISMLWWLIPVLLILGAIKVFKPFLKGKIGEFAVAAHVKLYLKGDYILLNDLTLPDIESGTTQIDHILLSPYGIFVIETKNYKGWIFGTERQKQWTQKIYKQSFKFQNPIHQNYKHMKVLEKILADILDKEFIHTVIVFMPEAVFKTDMPSNVFRGADWTDYVKTYKQSVISPMKLKRVQLRLEKEILEKSWKTNRQHVENLKQRHDS